MPDEEPLRLRITSNIDTVRSINDLILEARSSSISVERFNERSTTSQLDFDLGVLADVITLVSAPLLLRDLATILMSSFKTGQPDRVQIETPLERTALNDPSGLSIEELEELLRRLLGEEDI